MGGFLVYAKIARINGQIFGAIKIRVKDIGLWHNAHLRPGGKRVIRQGQA